MTHGTGGVTSPCAARAARHAAPTPPRARDSSSRASRRNSQRSGRRSATAGGHPRMCEATASGPSGGAASRAATSGRRPRGRARRGAASSVRAVERSRAPTPGCTRASQRNETRRTPSALGRCGRRAGSASRRCGGARRTRRTRGGRRWRRESPAADARSASARAGLQLSSGGVRGGPQGRRRRALRREVR